MWRDLRINLFGGRLSKQIARSGAVEPKPGRPARPHTIALDKAGAHHAGCRTADQGAMTKRRKTPRRDSSSDRVMSGEVFPLLMRGQLRRDASTRSVYPTRTLARATASHERRRGMDREIWGVRTAPSSTGFRSLSPPR